MTKNVLKNQNHLLENNENFEGVPIRKLGDFRQQFRKFFLSWSRHKAYYIKLINYLLYNSNMLCKDRVLK